MARHLAKRNHQRNKLHLRAIRVIRAAEQCKVSVLISGEIVAEINEVLTYPKITKICLAEGLRREELVGIVLRIAKFAKVTKNFHVVVGHPEDDKFIEYASTAGANYIVSGYKYLLKVACYKNTQIISVNEFLQLETVQL